MNLSAIIRKESRGFLAFKIVILSVFATTAAILGVAVLFNQHLPIKQTVFLILGNSLASLLATIEIKKTLKSFKIASSRNKIHTSLTNFTDSIENMEQWFYVIKDDQNTFRLVTPSDPLIQIAYYKPTSHQKFGIFSLEHVYSFNRTQITPLLPGEVPEMAKQILFEASKTQIMEHVLIKKQDWIIKRNNIHK